MHIAQNSYNKIAKKDKDNSIARIDTKGEQTIPDEQTCIKIYKKRTLLESNKRTHKKEARITLLPLHFGLSSDFYLFKRNFLHSRLPERNGVFAVVLR